MGELYLDNIEKFLTNEVNEDAVKAVTPSLEKPVKQHSPVFIFESSDESSRIPL